MKTPHENRNTKKHCSVPAPITMYDRDHRPYDCLDVALFMHPIFIVSHFLSRIQTMAIERLLAWLNSGNGLKLYLVSRKYVRGGAQGNERYEIHTNSMLHHRVAMSSHGFN